MMLARLTPLALALSTLVACGPVPPGGGDEPVIIDEGDPCPSVPEAYVDLELEGVAEPTWASDPKCAGVSGVYDDGVELTVDFFSGEDNNVFGIAVEGVGRGETASHAAATIYLKDGGVLILSEPGECFVDVLEYDQLDSGYYRVSGTGQCSHLPLKSFTFTGMTTWPYFG
jgi:hypothetical protein